MTQQLQNLLGRLAGASSMLGVGAWVLNESLYNVDGGHAAIVWNRFSGGVQPYIMEEGSHFSALGVGRAREFPPPPPLSAPPHLPPSSRSLAFLQGSRSSPTPPSLTSACARA